jgi:hypothetical protein
MTLTPSAPTRTPIDKKKDRWASGVTPYAEVVIIMMD